MAVFLKMFNKTETFLNTHRCRIRIFSYLCPCINNQNMSTMKRNIAIIATLLVSMAGMAQEVKLPAPNMEHQTLSVMQALKQRKSVRQYSSKELSAQELSDLLWAAQGVNRDNGNLTAATAMNRQEIRTYVFTAKDVTLYNPKQNTLTKIVDGDHRELMTAGQAFAKTAPVVLLLVADMKKFGSSDEHAKWLMGIDAGIVSENIYIYAAATGMATVARAMMDTKGISSLLKLSEQELPVLNHPVGFEK